MQPLVYIIIINWNGWKHTIECIESVMRLRYDNFRLIVCDNNSTDGSIDKIKDWAQGRLKFDCNYNVTQDLFDSTIVKPIPFMEYDRNTAENGGNVIDERFSLILINVGANLGFAGGNNVALRYVLARGNFEYVWLLNNDTVVTADALTYLVKRMQEKHDIGMCGSTLVYYYQPNIVQVLGGATYNKWLGLPKHIGANQIFRQGIVYDCVAIEQKMQYVVGASMLVRKQFLMDIGLMNEQYFLYFEELDWAVRAKGRYSIGYAAKSIVYHKEGGSIGSSQDSKIRSWISDYYGIRNRLLFTQRYYPEALITVYLGLTISLLNRVRRRQYDRVKMIWNIAQKFFTERNRNRL